MRRLRGGAAPGAIPAIATIAPSGVGLWLPDLRPLLGPNVSQNLSACVAGVVPFLLLSMVSRYRMADAVGRQQLKWFALAQLAAIGGVGIAALGAVLSHEPPEAGW